MSDDVTLGLRIRRARERRHWGQQQLADAVGVSLRTVGAWERGEVSAPRASIGPLEDVLGVSLGPVSSPGAAADAAVDAAVEDLRRHLMDPSDPGASLSDAEIERMVVTYRRLLRGGDERREAN